MIAPKALAYYFSMTFTYEMCYAHRISGAVNDIELYSGELVAQVTLML